MEGKKCSDMIWGKKESWDYRGKGVLILGWEGGGRGRGREREKERDKAAQQHAGHCTRKTLPQSHWGSDWENNRG